MKKLLVLSLVLAVAGLANAGFVFKYNGAVISDGGTVTDKGVLTFTLFNEFQAASIIDTSFVAVSGNAEILGITLYPANLVGTWSAENLGPTDLGSGKGELVTWIINNDFPAVGTFKQGPLADIQVQVNSGAQEFIYFNSEGEPIYTFAIPEPMTLGLLGVGALFLRKRS